MVKIAIVYEGETEEIIFNSDGFKKLLKSFNLEQVKPVKYISGKLKTTFEKLKEKGAEHIIIIRDFENDKLQLQFETEDEIKKHIEEKNNIIIDNINIHLHIVEPMIESWFLADTSTLKAILKIGTKTKFNANKSPEIGHSFQRITDLLKQYFPENKKTPTKTILAKRFIDKGFTIENSAKHKNCKSARKFIEFLNKI
jgi:hypothetical protein